MVGNSQWLIMVMVSSAAGFDLSPTDAKTPIRSIQRLPGTPRQPFFVKKQWFIAKSLFFDALELKTKASNLKSDASDLRSNAFRFKSNVSGFRSKASRFESKASGLKANAFGFKSHLARLESENTGFNPVIGDFDFVVESAPSAASQVKKAAKAAAKSQAAK